MGAKRLLVSVGALILAGVSIAMLPQVVNAATWQGPMKFDNSTPPVEYIRNGSSAAYGDSYPNASRQMEYVVSNDDFTDIRQTDILVYMPNRYGTIQIVNKDLCTNTQTSIPNSDANYAPNMPAGTTATEYRLLRPDGVSIVYARGFWDYAGPGACANNTLNMVASSPLADSVPVDPDSGMYVYRIRANALASGGKFANGFKIVAPVGSYISQDSESAASSFGLQPSYPIPGNNPVTPNPPNPYRVYTDVDIPFGPDCEVRPGQNITKTFDIYDADNVNNYDVQPRPFHVQLLRYNRNTGNYINTVDLNLVSGAATQQAPITSNIWRPTGGSQTTTRFSFVANGNEVYKLRISNLYYDNTLQFKIPFNNIWFFKRCAIDTPTRVRPVVTMTPNPAENGQALTATAYAQQLTNSGVNSRVNYGRLIWSDANRNGAYDTGERVFGGTPDSGTVDVPPPPGRYNFPSWTEVADTGNHGGRVCIRLSLAASPPVTIQSSPAVTCVDIGKKPKLHVSAGDVVVGGTFRNLAGVCPAQTQSATNLQLRGSTSTIGAATYASYTDYAANSLGPISVFGANGVNPQTGPSNNMSFGNDSPLGYFFSNAGASPGNPTRARCLSDPFAVFSSRPSFSTPSTSIDASNTGADILATASGTISIGGASRQLPAGYKRVIYAPNATTVNIVTNIVYGEGPYDTPEQLPQLIILTNGRIVINEGVTRLDGLYAAKGDIQTCNLTPLLSRCNQPLSIQGAVIAGGRVLPYRTAGAAAPNYGAKAESFHLRPDILLNQLPNPSTPTRIETINQREVPPRF